MENWNKDKVLEMAENRVITYSGTTLCDNYHGPLKRCHSASQAIRLYKNCISWALQEQYPTKEDLLLFADRETLAENGVFIDKHFEGELINNHICCVFLNCTGDIRVRLNLEKTIIPMLYLSDGSKLRVEIEDGSVVPVELYYGSKISTNKRKQIRVKDRNKLRAKDNIGFTPEQSNVDPNIINKEDL